MNRRRSFSLFRTVMWTVLSGLLLFGCASDQHTFKPGDVTTDLEIQDVGTTPTNPVAYSPTKGWVVARNADRVVAHASLGDGDFESFEMDAVTSPDEFLWVRYEADLPSMDDSNGLRVYFEATKGTEALLQPPTAPDEVFGYLPNLPDFPDEYVTPAMPEATPRWCNPTPERIEANEDCAGLWVAPFPTMHNSIWKPANEGVSIANMQRGVGVDFGNGESYFWPYSIMLWHEGSNHTQGGMRTVMTYCPLTDTAVYFDSGFDPNNLRKNDKFDVTGSIYNSNLISGYRHQGDDGTLFPQMVAYAFKGEDQGRCLDVMQSTVTDWHYWKKLHPKTLILEGDEVYPWYHYLELQNPYHNYWKDDAELRAPVCNTDDRRPNKSHVIGFYGEDNPTCFVLDKTSFVMNTEIDGRPTAIIYLAGIETAWTLERVVNGETIELQRADLVWNGIQMYTDNRDDPSFWTPEGVAVAGPLAGTRLRWVPSIYGFWFGWVANFPETTVYDPITGDKL